MSDPTIAQLDELLALQDLDIAIRRLRHRLDRLDEQQRLDEAQERLDALQRERDDLREEMDRAGAEQRQLERETDVLTQRRDAERSRLYDGTVSNARELRSVEAEIETTVRRIDEHEEQLLELLERIDGLESRAQALDSAIEAEQAQVVEHTAARDRAATEILAQLAEQEVARDAQASQVSAELLEHYDAVVARTGGVGIGRLEGQACSACRVELSMADVNTLLAGPTLTACPQCRRLLIVPD